MEIYTIQPESVLEELDSRGFYRPAPDRCMDAVGSYPPVRLAYRFMIDALHDRCGLPLGVSAEEYARLRQEDDEALHVGWEMVEEHVSTGNGDQIPIASLSMRCAPCLPHPVWAFQKVSGRADGKPDMRSWVTDEPEHVVRLRLEVPVGRLLFSDLDYWHIPLNGGYFPYADTGSGEWDAKDEAFDERCRQVLLRHGIDARGAIDLFSEKIGGVRDEDECPDIAALQRELMSSWENCIVSPGSLGSDKMPVPFNDIAWLSRETQCVLWEIREGDVKSIERFKTRSRKRAVTQ